MVGTFFMSEITCFVIRVVNDKNSCLWVILKGVQSIQIDQKIQSHSSSCKNRAYKFSEISSFYIKNGAWDDITLLLV